MNKQTRTIIQSLVTRLDEAQSSLDSISQDVADILSELESIRDDEQSKLDNMEEHFSQTDRFQQMQETQDALDEAYSSLESFSIDTDSLQETIDLLSPLA